MPEHFLSLSFPRELLGLSFRQILSLVSALVFGFMVSNRSYVGGLFGILVTFYPCFLGGSLNFLEGLLRSRERCPWKSYPNLMFLYYLDGEVFGKMIP